VKEMSILGSTRNRRAKKIWGKERVTPTFDESKNCKDPMY